MVEYRIPGMEDARKFLDMMGQLDCETDFMMYEPGERDVTHSGLLNVQNMIRSAGGGEDGTSVRTDFLLTAWEDGRLAGYIQAERGQFNRNAHTAYLVTGILKNYWGRGIGTEFFKSLDRWAKEEGVTRLELTAECQNTAALRLYEKNGFVIEGIRKQSMIVDGKYVDEYYMAKYL